MIACYLPTDKDVVNMMMTCRHFRQTLSPPNSGIWRSMFLDEYDPPPPDKSSLEIKWEYQFRSIILRKHVSFAKGEKARETLWLQCISTLINESFTYFPEDDFEWGRPSANIPVIEKALQDSEFLHRPVVGYNLQKTFKPSSSFLGIQICLTYLAVRLDRPFRALREDYDIGIAYGVGQNIGKSLLKGENLDLEQFLHIRNFWKRHLTSREEYTFHSSYKCISPGSRPKPWDVNFERRLDVMSNWTGYYSCIHPYVGMDDLIERQSCADFATHWDKIPQVYLHLTCASIDSRWPKVFEGVFPYLASVTPENRLWFSGSQWIDGDDYDYWVTGFLEYLPERQGGFPDFQRICFVIFDFSEAGEDEVRGVPFSEKWDLTEWGHYFEWAIGYEGLLLPAGRIMMGRWRDLLSEEWDGGPFIFWETY
ncbi:hypothetical protein PRK78_000998 [Emydomyces testavorans]|uniref:F-box domain-containing protein n=1 Tax=Emydomyces testavorans TaxID=2070801 RepID=A0AAF0DDK1_9EURO|nr:hypothetical protein PRK78_000998 [Emydomyces testavorans]